jgi:hypothetical protein
MGLTGIERIAMLPLELQEQLNRLLLDREPDTDLTCWLNSSPNVRRILWLDYGGIPINARNLSDWKALQLADKQPNGGGPVNGQQPPSIHPDQTKSG